MPVSRDLLGGGLMRFTPEQALAIERRTGELLLDAGAGSGKTSVLVERFAQAVHEDGIAIGQILTITFTEKAAAELRDRIRARLRDAGDDQAARATEGAWISTIHAFCARVLRTHALDAGLDPEFSVLDERETALLRRAAFDAALAAGARTEAGSELISAFGLVPLRTTVTATYAELRARGAIEPSLPPAPAPPDPLDLRSAALLVQGLAQAVQRELGEITDPGRRVLDSIELLERATAVLESGRPWPGELERLRLGDSANALKSQACDDYRTALAELQEMAAHAVVPAAHGAFDDLLRGYGAQYTELKRRRSGLDFADLELLARELLRTPEIGNRYRERFTRVMVDEMQDTNNVQLELIDLVAQGDLFMVGDAQQSIYGFRHADVELFAARGTRLEQLGARASLQTNFRSRAEILNALNGAFARELGQGFRPLTPGRDDEPAGEPVVELIVADRDATVPEQDPLIEQLAAPWRVAEARALAARVRELIETGQARAADVVLLLRATTDMRVYEQALEAAGVPTYVIGGRGYWSHPQVIELVAYLRALANPLDTEALYSLRLSPLCGASLDGVVLDAAGARDELDPAELRRVRAFEEWFAGERRAATWLGVEQLLERALAHNGYELHIAGLPDARRRLANVRKLMRIAREWQAERGSDLRGFVDLLQSRVDGGDGARESEAPVEGEGLDAVRLMTIHRSKGLEFPVVCVADLGRQVLPRAGALIKVGRDGERLGLRLKRPGHGQRVSVLAYDELKLEERERESEEERRLFYVAMTRAQERLIVSGAARLDRWHETNRFAPIGWVGAAFVPDVAERAAAAAAALTGGQDERAPEPFVTDEGVLVRFVSVAREGDRARGIPLARHAGGVLLPRRTKLLPDQLQDALPLLEASPLPEALPLQEAVPLRGVTGAGAGPPLASLSYTALATYEQCGYRFYVQRVLGLPDLPTPAAGSHGDGRPQAAGPAAAAAPASTQTELGGRERGTRVHQLLASLDLRNPAVSGAIGGPAGDSVTADVHALVTGLVGSSTFARLSSLREVRREQRFAFPVGETLITGVFDVIAEERPGRLLVLDYKTDRLAGADPEAIAGERYDGQRLIYALAALKLGAAEVEVLHVFLEAPDRPVSAVFTAAEVPTLASRLGERIAGPLSGDFRVTDAPGRWICDGCPAQGGLCSYPLEMTTG